MRQIFTIFFIIICSTTPHNAQGADDAFDHANELYQKGAFAKAYETYKTVTPATNNVHFNLGNCAFKLGHMGHALAHWRRAEHNWGLFGREELRHNIALLKAQLVSDKENNELKTVAESLTTLYQGTRNLLVPFVRAIPLLTLQIIVLFIWITLFICLRFFRKRLARPILIIFFMLFTCAAATLALKYSLNNRHYGVVVTKQAQLLSGPSDSFSPLGQLPEATELVILKQSGTYFKIRHANKLGWIKKEHIECL